MAAQVKSFHMESQSKTVSKNTSPQTSEMQKMSSKKGEELLKVLIKKRTADKGNVMENKQFNDSNKTSISAHNGKEILKVVRKGTEKLNTKENKCKSSTHSTMCFCSPTTHEGSFRCRLHRISAAKKSATEKSNMRLCSNLRRVEFKAQLSRFGRVATAEVGPHDSIIQLSGVESA